MKKRVHAVAGLIGLLTILTFWGSTAVSELLGSAETIAAVKSMILAGMLVLVPAMMIAAGSGRSLALGRSGATLQAKARRMSIIAGNGLLILVPSAFYLASKAAAGDFDAWFYGVQALELAAGATNIALMALNVRDGLRLGGRLGTSRPRYV
jgi:hypothetical protein